MLGWGRKKAQNNLNLMAVRSLCQSKGYQSALSTCLTISGGDDSFEILKIQIESSMKFLKVFKFNSCTSVK